MVVEGKVRISRVLHGEVKGVWVLEGKVRVMGVLQVMRVLHGWVKVVPLECLKFMLQSGLHIFICLNFYLAHFRNLSKAL